MSTPTDPLYASQWHLGLIGDLPTVWDDYDGSGVHVGIYDDGVEYTHPDLAANYDSTLDFSNASVSYDPFPMSAADAHGTAVAGLIGAAANGTGGVGVAPGTSLTGVNFLEDIQFRGAAVMDAAFAHATAFDLISNSWGVTPLYGSDQNLNTAGSLAARLDSSFRQLAEAGRGGLGTSVMKAAGNDNRDANADGANASRYSIVVAATDKTGLAQSYSNWGSDVLIAAPAAAVTTDRTGNNGYNLAGTADGDALADVAYTSTFGGTSAATPIVSGVVALMLDANPDLGWRDVKSILAASAALTGSAPGTSPAATEEGVWQINGAADWNGGGRAYHLNYGFGLVDAHAAVRMAEVWGDMFGAAATSANEISVSASLSGGYVPLADATGTGPGQTDVTLTAPAGCMVETVQATVTLTHSWAADLEMQLLAPDGSTFQIMDRPSNSSLMRNGLTWTFTVETARGMDSGGDWTLRVLDHAQGDSGQLEAAHLTFTGAAADTNDVHHITDDFATLIAQDTARASLGDANGGTDWLDLAAVTGDVALGLKAGYDLSIGGTTLATMADSGFENAVLGDGNDYVTGNPSSNRLLGMRGNDTLAGWAGNDLLEGGAGDDLLKGGYGNDWLDGGPGTDSLSGGVGKDWFAFADLSALSGSITDYSAAEGDRLILSGDPAQASLTVSAQDVVIGGLNLIGAAAGDVELDFVAGAPDAALKGSAGIAGLLASGDLAAAGVGYVALQFDANGDAGWVRVVTDYDAQGRATTRSTDYDDGSSADTVYDADGTAAYQYYVTSFATGGLKTQASYTWDTGRIQIVDYAADGASVSRQTEIMADSTRVMTLYDLGANGWANIVEHYDAGGTRYFKDVIYDDGARVRTNWDTGTAAHDYVIEEFDAAGAQTGKTVSYDDGSVLNVVYSGGAVWYQTQINTDGTRVQTSYDHQSANSWSAINEFRATSGALTQKQVFYDDGTRIYTTYDQGGNDWTTIAQTYDTAGRVDSKQVNYDAGNWTVTDYDQAGVFSWNAHVTEYAPDGTVANDYYV